MNKLYEALLVSFLTCICFFIGFYNWDDSSLSHSESGLLFPIVQMLKAFPEKIIIPMDRQGHTSGNVLLIPFTLFLDDPSLIYKLGQSFFASLGVLFTYFFAKKLFGVSWAVPAAAIMGTVPTYALAAHAEAPFLTFLSSLFLYTGALYYRDRKTIHLYTASWLLGFMFFYKLIFVYVAFAFVVAFWITEGRKNGMKRTGIGHRQAAFCLTLFMIGFSPLLGYNLILGEYGGGCCWAIGETDWPPVLWNMINIFKEEREDYRISNVFANLAQRCSQLIFISSEASLVGGNHMDVGLGVGCFLLPIGLIAVLRKKEKHAVFFLTSIVIFTLTSIFVTEKLNISHMFSIFPLIIMIISYPMKILLERRKSLLNPGMFILVFMISVYMIADAKMMIAFDDQKYFEENRPDKARYYNQLMEEVRGARTVFGAMDSMTAMKIYAVSSVEKISIISLSRENETEIKERINKFREEFPEKLKTEPVVYVLPSPDRLNTDFRTYIFSCPKDAYGNENCSVYYEEFASILEAEGKSLKEKAKIYDKTTGQPVWTVYYAE